MEPGGELLLVGGFLGRKSKDIGARSPKFLVMISKATGLRRTTTCARDQIPVRSQVWLARAAGPGIGVNDGSTRSEFGHGDGLPVSRWQRDIRHSHALKVRRGAIVDRRGKIRRQRVRIPHPLSVGQGADTRYVEQQ